MEKRYKVEILSDYDEWWRYNVYMMVVPYGQGGESGEFCNLIDKVLEVNSGEDGVVRGMPAGYKKDRELVVETEPCAQIELYIYVITNTFPRSPDIRNALPFELTLRVSYGAEAIHERKYEVNQLGGLTIIGKRFPES